jgi:hypothetical protein
VAFRPEAERAAPRPGYALVHMVEPPHERALTLRRAYMYPFWRIEATARREDWTVARTPFEPAGVDPAEAERFFGYWRRQVLPPGLPQAREGFVFVALQGRLLEHRSFQSMSPVEMVRATLAADPGRPLVLKPHPGESYSAAERAALAALAEDPRVRLTDAGMHPLLASCAYVVTQNSSVAFHGLFHRTPAVLFAGIDFHHPLRSVPRDGLAAAFRGVAGEVPDAARYLWWFLQCHSINAGRPDAGARILERVRALGWEV